MKYRFGFVSNSSSSSFFIKKIDISYSDFEYILDHSEIVSDKDDVWITEDCGTYWKLYTHMDNFDMREYLEKRNIKFYNDERDVSYEESEEYRWMYVISEAKNKISSLESENEKLKEENKKLNKHIQDLIKYYNKTHKENQKLTEKRILDILIEN